MKITFLRALCKRFLKILLDIKAIFLKKLFDGLSKMVFFLILFMYCRLDIHKDDNPGKYNSSSN